MILTGLSTEEQSLLNLVLENNLKEITSTLQKSDNSVDLAKKLLNQIIRIVGVLGTTWNTEHDEQGKLLIEKETLSSDTILSFYSNIESLLELLRSRFPILRSEKKVAFGTLVNVHNISALLELSLREKGYLTYYWGTNLTKVTIHNQQELNPANVFVLSCMAVTSEFNCFEELQKVRAAFPDLKIIVGGSAFSMFLLLKKDKDHPALTEPYKNPNYLVEIQKASNLKDFVKQVFQVDYCETIDEIIQEIEA